MAEAANESEVRRRRMRGLGWFEEMLDDPYRRVTLRGIGFIAFCLGIAGVVHSLVISIPERRKPIDFPVAALADGTGCSPVFGGGYRLTLKTGTHYCNGADYTCPEENNVPVIYNRLAPDHCRRADRVGRLSLREWFIVLTIAPGGTMFGLGLMLVRNNDPNVLRRSLAWSSLVLFLVLFLATLVWSALQGGDWLKLGGIWPRRQSSIF
jgi:hypothetical protein